MADQRLHRGIEPVAFPQLNCQAFGEIASAHAGRVEPLQDREHGIDFLGRRGELLTDLREVAGEVTGLVDEVDEKLPDHPPRRIGNRECKLLRQVVGKRRLDGEKRLDVVIAALATVATGPFRIAGRPLAVRSRRRRIRVGYRSIVGNGGSIRRRRIRRGVTVFPPADLGCIRIGSSLRADPPDFLLAVSDALEQRVSLKLPFDIGG